MTFVVIIETKVITMENISESKTLVDILGGYKYIKKPIETNLDLIKISERGIKIEMLQSLLANTSLTASEIASYLHISLRSIQRIKDTFSVPISERILKIAKLYAKGYDVFGDRDNFNAWLELPNIALGRKKPKEFLFHIFGIDLLLNELGRIEHGVLA